MSCSVSEAESLHVIKEKAFTFTRNSKEVSYEERFYIVEILAHRLRLPEGLCKV
jgi:hypothetical protein